MSTRTQSKVKINAIYKIVSKTVTPDQDIINTIHSPHRNAPDGITNKTTVDDRFTSICTPNRRLYTSIRHSVISNKKERKPIQPYAGFIINAPPLRITINIHLNRATADGPIQEISAQIGHLYGEVEILTPYRTTLQATLTPQAVETTLQYDPETHTIMIGGIKSAPREKGPNEGVIEYAKRAFTKEARDRGTRSIRVTQARPRFNVIPPIQESPSKKPAVIVEMIETDSDCEPQTPRNIEKMTITLQDRAKAIYIEDIAEQANQICNNPADVIAYIMTKAPSPAQIVAAIRGTDNGRHMHHHNACYIEQQLQHGRAQVTHEQAYEQQHDPLSTAPDDGRNDVINCEYPRPQKTPEQRGNTAIEGNDTKHDKQKTKKRTAQAVVDDYYAPIRRTRHQIEANENKEKNEGNDGAGNPGATSTENADVTILGRPQRIAHAILDLISAPPAERETKTKQGIYTHLPNYRDARRSHVDIIMQVVHAIRSLTKAYNIITKHPYTDRAGNTTTLHTRLTTHRATTQDAKTIEVETNNKGEQTHLSITKIAQTELDKIPLACDPDEAATERAIGKNGIAKYIKKHGYVASNRIPTTRTVKLLAKGIQQYTHTTRHTKQATNDPRHLTRARIQPRSNSYSSRAANQDNQKS